MGDALRPLEGRISFVTGASRGIGRAIAEALAVAGSPVALLSRDEAEGARAAEAIAERSGARCIAVGCDVRQERRIATAVALVRERLGRPAILVNCAGVLPRGPIESMTGADMEETFRVNAIAPMHLCRELAADLRGCGHGRVINVGSIFSVVGFPQRAVYAASKGALLQLTRALALEWAPDRVTVNAILPGVIDTPLTAPLMADADRRSEMLRHIPLGRFGQPGDIAPLSVFIAGDDAAYITGAAINVDGGWTAR